MADKGTVYYMTRLLGELQADACARDLETGVLAKISNLTTKDKTIKQ